MDEFLGAVREKWPRALVQFDNFSTDHCFELMKRYKEKMLCFNGMNSVQIFHSVTDDAQVTGAVVTAGFLNACKLGTALQEQRIVIVGAGTGGKNYQLSNLIR